MTFASITCVRDERVSGVERQLPSFSPVPVHFLCHVMIIAHTITLLAPSLADDRCTSNQENSHFVAEMPDNTLISM